MVQGATTNAQMPSCDFTSGLGLPQDLTDITSIVSDQTETERKLFLKRWKWSGVEC